MLKLSDFRDYQKRGVNFQCMRPHSMIWFRMGGGKTVTTLTTIKHLIQTNVLKSVLVAAPMKPLRTAWLKEPDKWEHLKGQFKFSLVLGTPDQRLRALARPADIYLINNENIKWLSEVVADKIIKRGKECPFDGIVWDEVTMMKNSQSQRTKAIMPIVDSIKWTTGLTGTPASNGYKDLHGQYLVVDKGQRLGRHKTHFTSMYYYKQGPYKLKEFEDTIDRIKEKISDITMEISAEEYTKLPDLIMNDIEIELPEDLRNTYDDMEKNFFLQLDQTSGLEIFNQSSLMNKCLQFSNGAVYLETGKPEFKTLHDLKLDVLEEILEDAQGSPVLCSYAFKSDAVRIMERFKHLKPINLTECKSGTKLEDAMNRWGRGECPLMIGHPRSMGHGTEGLQHAGKTLVWFGLTYTLEWYEQFNSRILRDGQKEPVMCHRIMTLNTFDQAQDLSLKNKYTAQKDLMNAVKEYRRMKYG